MKPALRRVKASNSREVLNQIFGAIPDLLYEKLHRVDGCGQIMQQDLPMNQFNLENVRSIEIENLNACELVEENPLNILPTCSGYYVVETCDDSPYYKIPTHPVGVGAVDVYFDGYKLIAERDYIEIDENHVRILQSAPAGTVIEFQIFSSEECSVEDVPDCGGTPGGGTPPTPPVYSSGAITSYIYPIYGIESVDAGISSTAGLIWQPPVDGADANFSIQSGILYSPTVEHTVYDPAALDADLSIQSGTLRAIIHEHTVYDPNSLDADFSIQSGTLEVVTVFHTVYDAGSVDADLTIISGSLTTP